LKSGTVKGERVRGEKLSGGLELGGGFEVFGFLGKVDDDTFQAASVQTGGVVIRAGDTTFTRQLGDDVALAALQVGGGWTFHACQRCKVLFHAVKRAA